MCAIFERDAYPYEFIHRDSDNIEFEITFNKNLVLEKYGSMSDLDILGWQVFYQWYRAYNKLEPSEGDEYRMILRDIIKITPWKITQVCLPNENTDWEKLYIVLHYLNECFNLKGNSCTLNKVLDVKIYGDLTKIIKNGQPHKGFVKNYTYEVNYTRTEEDKTKFVFVMNDTFNVNSFEDYNSTEFSDLEHIAAMWYTDYVNIHYRPSQIKRRYKKTIEDKIFTLVIPGQGINTKNLFFLLPMYEDKSKKIISLDIFSNDTPTIEYMRKFVDDFWKIKDQIEAE